MLQWFLNSISILSEAVYGLDSNDPNLPRTVFAMAVSLARLACACQGEEDGNLRLVGPRERHSAGPALDCTRCTKRTSESTQRRGRAKQQRAIDDVHQKDCPLPSAGKRFRRAQQRARQDACYRLNVRNPAPLVPSPVVEGVADAGIVTTVLIHDHKGNSSLGRHFTNQFPLRENMKWLPTSSTPASANRGR